MTVSVVAPGEETDVLFELRQYRVRPGRRAEWVALMDEVIVPFQTDKGMTIVGTFVAEDDPDLYVWIRRFESESERERQYRAVYEDERWTSEIAPLAADLLGDERMAVTRLIPTTRSAMR
jgi:NIPSNAP